MIDWQSLAAICFGGTRPGGWNAGLFVIGPLAILLLLYGTGLWRLWHSAGFGRGAGWPQAAAFLFGWLVLTLALVTPLHDLSRRLFAAHMIEHELVMTLAAPLLVLARPLGPMIWSLPGRWRRPVAKATRTGAYLLGWDILTLPLVAVIFHGLAIWLWHVPVLFEAALRIEWVHWAQHLSFLASALFFWWAVFDTRRRAPWAGLLILFVTALHTGFLGILITFAPQPIFPLQSQAAADWGLTPLADQQLAGLVMWVPGGMVYAVAALAMAGLWIGRLSHRSAAMRG